ncbi:MAG: SIS domain-containing protein [Parcubacteria group bacterium]
MTFDIGEQLKFRPEILDSKVLNFDNVVVGGMGGSALPARAVFYLDPVYPLWLHHEYGLPRKTEGKTLFVAISYSGNTAETLSFAREAHSKSLPLAVITSGGALKDFAQQENIARILVQEGLEPRDALVYMLRSLLLILGRTELLEEIDKVQIDPEKLDKEAKELADFMQDKESLIYSSEINSVLGYIWKIFLNESAKMPAFSNSFPELAHNELESLNDDQRIILLSDSNDSPEIRKEMKMFLELAKESNWNTKEVSLDGSRAENLVGNVLLARSVAHNIAKRKGLDPDVVPTIEKFKRKLK